jgi:hypothetical protein
MGSAVPRLLAFLLLVTTACAENVVVITLEGSERTTTMIPRRSDASDGLEEGFTVIIEKLLLVISDLQLSSKSGTAVNDPRPRVWNAKKLGAFDLARANGVAHGRYDGVSFSVATASTALSGNADPFDVARMNGKGYSVYLEGVASRKFIYAFRWGFDRTFRFEDCGGPVQIASTGVTRLPLVIHGERFFMPGGFQRIRDADLKPRDDYTTVEELEAADLRRTLEASIADLFEDQGRCQGRMP